MNALLQQLKRISGRWSPSPRVASHAVVVVTAAGLAASYLLTWDLWRGRIDPPNLPAVGALSSLDFGAALVAAAVAAMVFPRAGSVIHSAILLLAMLGDQIRLQPEFVSLGLLLAAAAWPPTGMAIARWHLITLWGWAGLHKILSIGWPEAGAPFIASAAGRPELRSVVAVAVPLAEVGLAALALRARTWRILWVAAALFHVGVVVVLARIGWNSAIWPWNVALAAVTPFLFNPASAPNQDRPALRSRSVVVAAVLFALYPVGFYFGMSDAYPSHNLYSANTAQAVIVCRPEAPNRCTPAAWYGTVASLNVPFPPERRLYVAWFERICEPGERLRIDGIWTRLNDRQVEFVECARR
ncbi:MAG TPA: hypothetical protein VHI54_09100 [Actinomycetota bacterium]|nr:hypothetical protein [Actinomycetota bacterium]